MFVFRENGRLVGYSFARQTAAQEELADDHPDLVAYFLATRKRERLVDVASELARRNAYGFVHDGKRYQVDDASQARITALVVKADRFVAGLPGATWDVTFIAADNSEVAFTAAEFGVFADAASNVVIARRMYARDLKNRILAAADRAALDAIDVTAGWP